jgi:hypothetical protein
MSLVITKKCLFDEHGLLWVYGGSNFIFKAYEGMGNIVVHGPFFQPVETPVGDII